MSPESKDVTDSLAEQLTSFDDKLNATANDVDMLTGIRRGINSLLAASGNNEAEIRQVLQHQYDSGALRKETFQLVKSMLDSYSTENMPTSPDAETVAVQQRMAPAAPGPASRDFQVPAADQQRLKTVIPAVQNQPPVSESGVQVGSVLRDRYLLHQAVAGGSMGAVYKAMDRRLAESGSAEHWVAIKMLSPKLAENSQALRALQQEAAKGRCLVHPNIVKFIDLDRDGNHYFLVMEWLEGRSLADILDSKDASIIDFKTALRIVRQIGGALDYAHSRGIVHADIKPGNIMVMPNGDAKLFDFGVARIRQQHAEAGFDPGVLGALTPAYSSMQVLTGEEPAVEDDVFSLCCLLYRLIAGYRVFGPRNAAEASEEGMEPQRLKGMNDSQWQALKKGLSYSRVTRHKSVRDFVDALGENEEEAFRVEAPERVVEIEKQSSAGKWIFVFILLAGLAAGAAYQQGYLDTVIERFMPPENTSSSSSQIDVAPIAAANVDLPSSAQEEPAAQSGAEFDATNPFAGLDAPLETGLIEPKVASNAAVDSPDSSADVGIDLDNAAQGAASNELEAASSAAIDESEMPVASEPEAIVSEVPEQTDDVARPLTEEVKLTGSGSNLVDFSTLPPPTEVIPFSPSGGNVKPVNIAVREDGPSVIIDFVRGSGLSEPLTLRLEEVGFSGDLSPWATGEYALSDSGLIYFPAGQARGRVSLMLASDGLREADQQSTLRLRDASRADSELAIVNLTLEDDDRRTFEARLPRNTIAFSSNKATASESEAAVQIDLVRFSPDNTSIAVNFVVSDLSAANGEDYFGPDGHTVSFGPGQRSARLLVPLVQDTETEGDETFVVELVVDSNNRIAGIDQHIVVTIRDDDPRIP